MSCGVRITPSPYGGYHERDEMAQRLYDRGEIGYTEFSKLRHGECMDSWSARRVESGLESLGMDRHYDYKVEQCYCDDEDEW